MKRTYVPVCLFLLAAITVTALHCMPAGAAPKAAVGKPAPLFKLPGKVAGQTTAISDFRGHPTALFFFCGCEWCFKCGTAWAKLQPALPPGSRTVVVFASSYSDALEFAHQTNLDLSTTTLLSDPEDHVPDDLYNAPTCPRVFVLDPNGIIRYTNNHADDAPRLVPGMAIALKALTAMRAAAPPTAPASAATGSSSP